MSSTARSSSSRPAARPHPSTRPWERPVLERLGSWRALTMQISSLQGGPQEVPIGPGNVSLIPDPGNPTRLG